MAVRPQDSTSLQEPPAWPHPLCPCTHSMDISSRGCSPHGGPWLPPKGPSRPPRRKLSPCSQVTLLPPPSPTPDSGTITVGAAALCRAPSSQAMF